MSRTIRLVQLASTVVLICAAVSTFAQPAATNLFSMRSLQSANADNFATGDIFFWGANSVVPAATSFGFTRQCPSGASCIGPNDPDFIRQRLFWRNGTLNPNFYTASRPYDASLTGPWTLILSSEPNFPFDPTKTVFVNTPSVGAAASMPFVTSMSVQGAGLTPTISWTLPSLPPGLTIDSARVQVFDRDHPAQNESRSPAFPGTFQTSDLIFTSGFLPGTQASFSIPAGSPLQFGTHYSIAIELGHLRVPGVASFSNVDTRSFSFFEFTPLNLPGLDVFLPTTQPIPTTSGLIAGPVYSFNVANVSPNQVTFIDPFVATGYTYIKGADDPNFRSVQVATNVGDGLYDLYIWNGSSWVLIEANLGVDEEFLFSPDGVDRFQILGIEESAGLSPFDVTAFVTGLTFVAEGSFTGTMQAIAAEVSGVPEPGSLALLAIALAAVGFVRRRGR